jgi:hypothetical protein
VKATLTAISVPPQNGIVISNTIKTIYATGECNWIKLCVRFHQRLPHHSIARRAHCWSKLSITR